MDSPTVTETPSCSPTGEEQDPNSIWHNFLVNLSPKLRKAGCTSSSLGQSLVSPEASKLTINSFAMAPSGDVVEEQKHADFRYDGTHHKLDNGGGGDENEWYQFEEDDLLEPATAMQDHASDLAINGQDHLEVHALSSSRRGFEVPPQFRKSWGNFTNIFDEQGRQKNCIWRSELSNYLQLRNQNSATNSEYIFLASLFTGNYPKPLFRSTWSWRMRWNVFVAGIDEQILVEIACASEKNKGTPINCNGQHRRRLESGDEKVLHLGEMHIYLHVERGHQSPVYQNLCFFFDPNLVAYAKNATECKPNVKAALEEVAFALKQQLSVPEFVSQLYFPIKKERFGAMDQSVQYFELRQQDLQAAIEIANELVPFAFLHRAPMPPTATVAGRAQKSPFSGSSGHSNSSRLSWSTGRPSIASAISPGSFRSSGASSAASWRRRNSWED